MKVPASIGGQRLKILPFSFPGNNVKGNRRFARARHPDQTDHFISGNGDVDIFQVIFPGALNHNLSHLKLRGLLAHGFLSFKVNLCFGCQLKSAEAKKVDFLPAIHPQPERPRFFAKAELIDLLIIIGYYKV